MRTPEDLLSAMTLTEKIGQLTMVTADYAVTGPTVATDVTGALRAGRVGSLFNLYGTGATRAAQKVALEETRLGIPLFFAHDVIHGFRAICPIPLGEASAFDPTLWKATGRWAATEAAEAGLDLVFAPMLDVARDPRWGRIAEGPGEDTRIGRAVAEAKVNGFQGRDLAAADAVAACAKHYVAYGACAAGRDYASVDISDRTLEEVYLPPFKAAVEAGVATVMAAFTDLAGVPLTAHEGLLDGVLRRRWRFDGVIMSDYGAIGELMAHGVAADLTEAAALALRAGVDIDMMAYAYEKGLPQALERGLVTVEQIDRAVMRVLELKRRLGLFDDPYRRRPAGRAELPPVDAAARRAAREVAGRCLVLLRNRDNILPLPDVPGSIALIGPLADAGPEMLGNWTAAGRGDEAISVLAGLRRILPDAPITHAPGGTIDGETIPADALADTVAAAEQADHVILCLGEAGWMSGEAACRARLDLPGAQEALARAVLDVGKPVIVLLFSGRPLAMEEIFDRAAAVVACWFPGVEAGTAIADLLTGAVNPAAKLPVTWPRHVGQVPIHHAQRPGGRPFDAKNKYTSKYLDMPNTPRFAFGHGLSYTTFGLSGIKTRPMPGGVVVLGAVSNDGRRPGKTTLFLFVRDPVARLSRPVLALARFETMHLGVGEARRFGFTLTREDLGFLDEASKPTFEAGQFDLFLGFSADPERLTQVSVTVG